MSDDSNKKNEGKVGGVGGAGKAKEIASTSAVDTVSAVKGAEAVRGVSSAKSVKGIRATKVMSLADREEMFRLVEEEAKKLFPEGTVNPKTRAVLEKAVQMAIDAGLVEMDTKK